MRVGGSPSQLMGMSPDEYVDSGLADAVLTALLKVDPGKASDDRRPKKDTPDLIVKRHGSN